MTAHAGGAAPPSDRSLLRAELRARRRALSAHERASASRQFARILRRSNLLRPGRHVAVYVAHDSEADPSAIVRLARRNRCELYLPAIADYRHRRMEFRRYARDTRLRPNRYGIAEPARSGASTWFWYRWSPSIRAERAWERAPASTTAACITCVPDVAGADRS